MGNNNNSKYGLAGEFRVMSELLLRGHNPAKSYLEEGADIILQNGLRIEVKSSRRRNTYRCSSYAFCFRSGRQKKARLPRETCDFVICWCIEDNDFYIFPSQAIPQTSIGIGRHKKYIAYKERWDLLNQLEVE